MATMVLLGLSFLVGPVDTDDSAGDIAVRAVFASPVLGHVGGEAPAHLFCDRDACLAIDVSASSPRRIDLRARLIQLGSGLAAPLGDAIPVIVNEEIGPTSRTFDLRLACTVACSVIACL